MFDLVVIVVCGDNIGLGCDSGFILVQFLICLWQHCFDNPDILWNLDGWGLFSSTKQLHTFQVLIIGFSLKNK